MSEKTKNKKTEKHVETKKNIKTTLWAFKFAFKVDPLTISLWALLSIIGASASAFFIKMASAIVDKAKDSMNAGVNTKGILISIVILASLLLLSELNDIIPSLLRAVMQPRYSVAIQREYIDKTHKTPGWQFDQYDFTYLLYKTCFENNCLANFVAESLAVPASLIGIFCLLVVAVQSSIWLLIPSLIFTVWSIINGLLQGAALQKLDNITDRQYTYRWTFYNYAFDRKLVHETRTLNAGWFLNRLYNEFSEPILKNNLEWNKDNFKRNSVRQIAVIFCRIAIIFIGLGLFLTKNMSVGALAMLPALFNQLINNTDSIGYKLYSPYQYIKYLNDQKTFLETDYGDDTPRLKNVLLPVKDPETVFELKNVYHRYAKDKPLTLENVSLKIKKGEIVSLVGLNGAGKTTIIKLLLGFANQESGEILFNGRPIQDVSRYEFQQRVGAVFQTSYTYDFSIRENIGVANIDKIDNDEIIMNAARLGGAEKIVKRAPQGLETYIGKSFEKGGIDLSGGEMQRLSLARTQMIEKEVMLLDEPAAALDPVAELEQYERLRSRLMGHTVVLVSHRISFSRLADRIIVLDGGHVAEEGTHDELMAKNGLYKEMFNSQAQWYKEGEPVEE